MTTVKKDRRRITLGARRMAIAIIAMMTAMTAEAQKDRTIKVMCDWDFPPYEFVNGERKPDGYNVELIHTILKRLGIKHEFVLKARKSCIELFNNNQADLIVDYIQRYKDTQYYSTTNAIEFYNFSVAYLKGTKPVKTIKELAKTESVVLNSSNDSISYMALKSIQDTLNLEYHSVREALAGIANGDFKYFVWGEETLKWQLKSNNLNDIEVASLDIPANDMHIVGHDKSLIDAIDSEFARMQQSGEVETIRNKWFHPERLPEKPSSTLLNILLLVILASFIIYAIYRIAKQRVRAAIRQNEDMEAMMHQALSMSKYSVLINELKEGRVVNQHGHVLPDDGISIKEMINHIHPQDRQNITGRRNSPDATHKATPFNMRWNKGTDDNPQWLNVTGYSYAEVDRHGVPVNIIITARDISEEMKKEQKEHELASRYARIFDSTQLAMSFYDAKGNLIDLNESMKELCGIKDDKHNIISKQSIFDLELAKDALNVPIGESFHVCQHMLYPEAGVDKYIELRIRPVADDTGELVYYVITARDVTIERSMYLELTRQSKALKAAGEINRTYERELRTLLENCNMYVWHADIEKRVIIFTRSLEKEEFSETFEQYIASIAPEHQEEAKKNIENIYAFNESFSFIHLFNSTPVTTEPRWFSVSGMPLRDKNGHVTELFGVARDVTDLMEAQQRLKEETARAENSAILKSTFLANMTHEIRTPLNAIVGFSDLLHSVDSTEERMEFIRIIRNNCDMLLRLINDIFEASTMDTKPLEIKPAEVDFASEFNIVCHSLAQRVQTPGVKFIVENPFDSFVTTLDMGRMQQVITNFVTNAIKYTQKGHIRVGYRYEDGGLHIFCEDTGAGIPKEKQGTVFDRFVKLNDFVQGTGLGLSICKSIAEGTGGRIGVESDGEGKGSTFWIWIPCKQNG